jgi:hypothetical protein
MFLRYAETYSRDFSHKIRLCRIDRMLVRGTLESSREKGNSRVGYRSNRPSRSPIRSNSTARELRTRDETSADVLSHPGLLPAPGFGWRRANFRRHS